MTCARSDLVGVQASRPDGIHDAGPGAASGSCGSAWCSSRRFLARSPAESAGRSACPASSLTPIPSAHRRPCRNQTVVRLAGRIGIDGLFTDLHDVSDNAQPAYVASALEASRQWVFTRRCSTDAPIEVNIRVTVITAGELRQTRRPPIPNSQVAPHVDADIWSRESAWKLEVGSERSV